MVRSPWTLSTPDSKTVKKKKKDVRPPLEEKPVRYGEKSGRIRVRNWLNRPPPRKKINILITKFVIELEFFFF